MNEIELEYINLSNSYFVQMLKYIHGLVLYIYIYIMINFNEREIKYIITLLNSPTIEKYYKRFLHVILICKSI